MIATTQKARHGDGALAGKSGRSLTRTDYAAKNGRGEDAIRRGGSRYAANGYDRRGSTSQDYRILDKVFVGTKSGVG